MSQDKTSEKLSCDARPRIIHDFSEIKRRIGKSSGAPETEAVKGSSNQHERVPYENGVPVGSPDDFSGPVCGDK